MTNASKVEASAKASVFVVVRQNDGLSKARM